MSAAAPPPAPALTAIETPRLRLEPLLERHAARLFPDLCDPQLYAFLDAGPPASAPALAARYRFLEARRSPDGSEAWLNWALLVRDARSYAGTVQATVRAREAEIAYVLFLHARGRGIASEAVAAMLQALAAEWGARAFLAHVDPRNRPSIALLERLGFVRSGTRAASNPAQPESDLVFRRGPL